MNFYWLIGYLQSSKKQLKKDKCNKTMLIQNEKAQL